MTKEHEENMEERILEMAEKLFLEKGYNQTSTTEIAKAAGCTQALVHYYFRTKDNLFQKIFSDKVHLFIETIEIVEDESLSFQEMLRRRITRLFDLLVQNPRLPSMILNEYITNHDRRDEFRQSIMRSCCSSIGRLKNFLDAEMKKGNIRETDAVDLTLNIFSLVVPFFVYLPFLKDTGIITEENRDTFISHRKEEIIETILRSLQINRS